MGVVGGREKEGGGWGTTDKIASLIAASIITLQLSSAVALPVSHLECTHTSRRRTAGTHGCALSYREDADRDPIRAAVVSRLLS